MDNVTHALAGLLLADATTAWIERRTSAPASRGLRRAIVALGLVAAELPDADLLYSGPAIGMGKLGYLLHHRGHTHTIVFAVLAAFVLWWAVLAVRRRATPSLDVRERVPLLTLALAGSLSHVLLDFTNTYGVHPFWPIDNRWVYGDAVFIVEPWLWIAAIAPLLFGPRQAWSRVVLSLLMGVILLASWTLGEMSTALALLVTCGAAVWLLVQRFVRKGRHVAGGLAAWCLVEAVFAVSSARAAASVREPISPDEHVVDVVVSPGAANPLCFDALVVSITAREYRVRSATIAPWSHLGASAGPQPRACRRRAGSSRFDGLLGVSPVTSHAVAGVVWGEQWAAPRAELLALAESRCEMSAALRFLRVPVWTHRADGVVRVSDARFGTGSGGFTDLLIAAGPCPLSARAWIPPWTPPRSEVIDRAPTGRR
ncbi:MAG: metal-dependent hydrolase [Gemmatimonas sp.]